jgi:hypothetical protein
MASKVAMRPLATRTRRDAHTLMVACARCCSGILEPPCQLPTRTHIVHRSARAHLHTRASVMTCDRSTHMPLFLGLKIGACTLLFIRFMVQSAFYSFLHCAPHVLERRNLVRRAFWRGERAFKGVRGVGDHRSITG